MTLSSARSRAVVTVIAFAAMLSSLQFTLIMPALPEAPRILQVSPSDASWLVTATLLASTVTTPILSRQADIYGRRMLMMVAIGFLFLGSVVAALGMTFTTIIIGRVLQGFASAVVPIGVGLIHAHVPRSQANRGVALLSGTIGVGSALGLPLSGFLLEWVGFSGIFWASAIGSAIFLILIWAVVPETNVKLNKSLDSMTAVLLSIWLLAVTLAISKGAEWGWLSFPTVASLLTAVLGGIAWIKLSIRNPNAVIDLGLAVRPRMIIINVATFFTTFGMFTNHLITMQEAQAPRTTGYGLDVPLVSAGLVLLPFAITMTALAPVASWSINRFGSQITLMVGAATMALAFTFRILVHGHLLFTILGTVIVAIGVGLSFSAMPALVSEASPPSELASANGVNSLVRTFAGAITSSVFALTFELFSAPENPLFLSERGFLVSFVIGGIVCLIAALIIRPHKAL